MLPVHSNATLVTITTVGTSRPLPARQFGQNSTNPQVDSGEGLGLRNIEDRVEALDGPVDSWRKGLQTVHLCSEKEGVLCEYS